MVAGWPYKVLQLISTEASVLCTTRQNICKEILQQPDSKLHIVPRKLKSIYANDLKIAAATGAFPAFSPLACALEKLKVTLKSNTTASERVNKMLGMFGDRYPSATNELISSRAGIKFSLGDVLAAKNEDGRPIPKTPG